MSEIKVPEGMLKAALGSVNDRRTVHCPLCSLNELEGILKSAIQWLSENPIAPTNKQAESLHKFWREYDGNTVASIDATVTEWQRRMFLEPEPEIPEAVRDLFVSEKNDSARDFNRRITVAYKLGKDAK
jgi:hypothetical protein